MALGNQSAVISAATAADQTIVPAVAGKKIAVLGYVVVNGVATGQTITWKSGSTAISGAMPLPQSVGGGLSVPAGHPQVGYFTTAESAALVLTMSAATQVSGHVAYKYV